MGNPLARHAHVTYTGKGLSSEASAYMAKTPLKRGTTYTVAHFVASDGAEDLLYLKEHPEVRCYAAAFHVNPWLPEHGLD